MKLNKTLSLLLTLGTNAAIAGTMGPVCDAVNVSAPCTSAWDLGGSALYLQPSYSNVTLASQQTVTDPDGSNRQTFGLTPNYAWGFFLEGSRHFDHAKDFNINVYYLDNSQSETNALAAGGQGSGNFSTNWFAANFEFGQSLNVEQNNGMRIHGGVQYAHLKTRLNFAAIVNAPNRTANLFPAGFISAQRETSFNGFGPRIGVDLGYDLPGQWIDGFRVYANGAAGLLAGSIKSSGITSAVGIRKKDYNQVVPELDAKIGLKYMHNLAEYSKFTEGQLTFDAGWMWVEYLSAVDEDADTRGAGNINFQGLYFGLKWMGNIA